MQTENNLNLEINHYTDSDYNTESNFRYHYYLFIGEYEMISVIADEQRNAITSFKVFKRTTFEVQSFLEMNYDDLKLFTEITDDFKPNYKSKKVIIADSSSIFSPDSLYNSVELETYFKLNKNVKVNSQVLYNKLNFQHIVNLFCVRNETLKFIRFNMPTADILHQNLLFVKACNKLDHSKNDNHVFLNFNIDSIDLLNFKNSKLHFFNNFKFDNHTDIVYYILAIVEQLEIANDWHLTIYGNIEGSNSLFQLLGKYCKNMKLGKRSSQYIYPVSMDSIPENYYFTALNVLLCE
jgi:hypothetical protein